MNTEVLDIDTARRRTVDLTELVRSFCAGAGSDSDLVDTLERLLPRDGHYRHAHGSPGHGASPQRATDLVGAGAT